jgi:hypothetical protein
MPDIETITNIKTLCLQQLSELRVNPKPTYDIDGQKVSWETYCCSLERSIDWCDRKLAELQPFEVMSQGVT